MAKKPKTPSQRNPYVEHMRFKKSGAHVKPKKTLRKKEKEKLRKLGKDYFNNFILEM